MDDVKREEGDTIRNEDDNVPGGHTERPTNELPTDDTVNRDRQTTEAIPASER